MILLIGVIYYLRTFLDASGSLILLLNSETNNYTIQLFSWINIQSAENFTGFSETIRQLSGLAFIYLRQRDKHFLPFFTSRKFSFCQPLPQPQPQPQPPKYNSLDKNRGRNEKLLKKIEPFTPLPPLPPFGRAAGEGGGVGSSKKNSSIFLTHVENIKFYSWLAGIIDGDGNFDIRKIENTTFTLKAIRIKLHNRDVRILTRIQNNLHVGRIKTDKHKPYSIFIISKKEDMFNLITNLNGLIRIKVPSFKKACELYEIPYIEPNYDILKNDPYFSGLIDTDGSVVFNFSSNRIECNLEFQYNEYSSKLNLNSVIPNYKPYILIRKKHNQNFKLNNIEFKSIAFKFQTVKGMLPLYDYFIKNRLYSDFKFYRVTQIKKFIVIRDFKHSEFDSVEYQIYSDFLLN